MADFGTLDFSVSLKPTSAFPLDARCYFTSLTEAAAAAATAEEAGSTNSIYFIGEMLMVYENGLVTWYYIKPDKTLGQFGASEQVDIEVVDAMIEGNMNPITSNAVYKVVGNIHEVLLTI